MDSFEPADDQVCAPSKSSVQPANACRMIGAYAGYGAKAINWFCGYKTFMINSAEHWICLANYM